MANLGESSSSWDEGQAAEVRGRPMAYTHAQSFIRDANAEGCLLSVIASFTVQVVCTHTGNHFRNANVT